MATTATSRLIWSILPDPLQPLKPSVLAMAVIGFTGLVLLLQTQLTSPDMVLSPLHLALAGIVFTCCAACVIKSLSSLVTIWRILAGVFAAIALFEIADLLPYQWHPGWLAVAGSNFLALVTIALALVALVSGRFQTLAALVLASLFALVFSATEQFDYTNTFLQFALLLCGQLFLTVIYSDGVRQQQLAPPKLHVGTMARFIHATNRVNARANHPPMKAAYYPGLKELTVVSTIGYLLAQAGPRVKQASGRSYVAQAWDMARLWFRDGIDPPSYYQLELYDSENLPRVPDYLTRYETKNGLFSDLNKTRENAIGGNEMGDKSFFAQFCTANNLPYPHTLATIGPAEPPVDPEKLQRDLFIKPHKGNGANNAMFFKYIAPDQYTDDHGHALTLNGLVSKVLTDGARFPMLVQPHLSNHPEIADIAKDSLLTFRVVTCLNEREEPEVVLSMLRLLSKLEPDWKNTPALPDLEYAAAINLSTGTLGEFLGDGFTHVPDHHTHHPVTGSQIAGRTLACWPQVRDLSLQAHQLLKHRVAIGWDIAMTPDGPVLLEGNHSFDVMFLQRVHMKPIGETRLGDLLIHHMRAMFLAH